MSKLKEDDFIPDFLKKNIKNKKSKGFMSKLREEEDDIPHFLI